LAEAGLLDDVAARPVVIFLELRDEIAPAGEALLAEHRR